MPEKSTSHQAHSGQEKIAEQIQSAVDATLALQTEHDATEHLIKLAGIVHHTKHAPIQKSDRSTILNILRNARTNNNTHIRALARVILVPVLPYDPTQPDLQNIMGATVSLMIESDTNSQMAPHEENTTYPDSTVRRYLLQRTPTGSEVLDTVMSGLGRVLTGEIGLTLAARDWFNTVYEKQLPALVRCWARNHPDQTFVEPGAYAGTRLGKAVELGTDE